ncbi:MAG: STAS domain-containing protein [Cyanobacteria bacterium P01_A01_bin.3]
MGAVFLTLKEIGTIADSMNLTVSLRGSYEQRPTCQIVHLTGQFDAFSEPNVRKEFERLLESGPQHLILDMKGIDFLDSSGLGVLIQTAKQIEGKGSLQIIGNPRVVQSIKLVRLEKFLPLRETLDEALAAVPN